MAMTRLREERQRKGLSIATFSHGTLLNPSSVSVVERRKGVASPQFRRAVSEYFGISEENFFDSEGFAV